MREAGDVALPAIDWTVAVSDDADGPRAAIASGVLERALAQRAGNPSANLRMQPKRWSILIDNYGAQMRAIVLIVILLLIWAISGMAFAALPAPIGHRQFNASNVPASVLDAERQINTEDIELDKRSSTSVVGVDPTAQSHSW
jgi:hypothetical protein